MKYYFAYGMNTNLDEMQIRCRTARSLGHAVLPNYSFEFKTHATIEPNPGRSVHGVLWEILESDEKSLDILEGFPIYYTKHNVKVRHNDKDIIAMTYMMDVNASTQAPSDRYYDTVTKGYNQHNVPTDQLVKALKRSLVY